MVQVNGDKTGQLIASWQKRLDDLNAAVGVVKQWYERYHAVLVSNLGSDGFTREQADTAAVKILQELAPHRGRGSFDGEAGKAYSYVYWYTSSSSTGYPALHSATVFVNGGDGVQVYPSQHGGWGPAILEAIKEAEAKATFYAKVIAMSGVLTGRDETIGDLRAEAFAFLKDYKGAQGDNVAAYLASAWPNLFGGGASYGEDDHDD